MFYLNGKPQKALKASLVDIRFSLQVQEDFRHMLHFQIHIKAMQTQEQMHIFI